MRLDRTDDEESLTLPSATTRRLLISWDSFCLTNENTGLVGYDGVVLEVTEASQVVTVILF
jgi:hypothetical protein